ncbi:MAG: two-component system phosphate regulon sensor histidine kinase PhoR [Urechidicola sp.]|jgi:two-component system phosphate regulon sensor histidine kinase PhoR
MNKKVFILIIFLMSISLIGIIAVQVFWIQNSIVLAENQFKSDVNSALTQVSENINDQELNDYIKRYSKFTEDRNNIKESKIKDFFYQQVDTTRQETFEYKQTILEENYRVPTEFFENDTINFTKIFSKESLTISKNKISIDDDLDGLSASESLVRYKQMDDVERMRLRTQRDLDLIRLPIYQRVSNQELTWSLERMLESRAVVTQFKYGVYNNDLATKLKSGYFSKDVNTAYTYMVPLFVDSDGESDYQLYVSFPNKKNYLLSSIWKILVPSMLFILIIILAFISSLYQMIKQKQISEIKTDFINNMTHEFKTPIATINLALDAIKNPKIIDDKDKVLRYVQMIRDENKRMHGQVENVLRISKLEKNQLDLSKDKQDVHEIIEEAITHVELLVQSRDGYIKTHLKANLTEILANQFHLTNVIVNMLDNAIKYSPESPKIDIETESTAKNIIIKVKDQGIGMSKTAMKSVFKKFYREETGNVHNVKGHGLGLSYVKKIIEHHQGTVHVESEKGKGSTFIIKLSLI